MDGNSFIKDIGRSYIVSSVLPAMLFISLGLLLFRGFIPEYVMGWTSKAETLFGGLVVFYLAFISWVSFCLYSMVNFIIRLYEGYYFPAVVQKFMVLLLRLSWHNRRTQTIRQYLALKDNPSDSAWPPTSRNRLFDSKKLPKWLKGSVVKWRALIRSVLPPDNNQTTDLYSQALADYSYLEFRTPIDSRDLLPTRFGNVLRASEKYAQDKYLGNGIVLWPRLFCVLPDKFNNSMEDWNNRMVFLLNSSLLCYLNGLFALVVWLLHEVCSAYPTAKVFVWLTAQGFFQNGFTRIMPSEYLGIAILWLILGYFIYLPAVNTAVSLGVFIRSGFDLYRFELLRRLNLSIPKNLIEERITWYRLSEFLVAGDRLGNQPLPFEYIVRKELEDAKSFVVPASEPVLKQKSPSWSYFE